MADTNGADAGPSTAHIRIPNRLFEAVLDADFTDRQKVICYALLRVTTGWNQASATMTQDELAELCGMVRRGEHAGGTFRAALKELEKESVVFAVDRGPGRPKAYALNPDFEKWGRFSIAPNRLKKRFGTRYENADLDLKETISEVARAQAEPVDGHAHPQADLSPTDGRQGRPLTGVPKSVTPISDNDLQGRKDMTDRKDRTTTATTAADEPSDEARYCLGITTAANAAITKKWGEQIHPLYYGTATQLAADLIQIGIKLDVAQKSIAAQVDKSKNVTPPSSIEYFRRGILQSGQSDEQRAIDAVTPLPSQVEISQRSTAMVDDTVKMLERYSTDREMLPKYERERERAAKAWSEAPANAVQVAAITRTAEDANAFLGPKWVARSLATALADACGFPKFDVWLAARRPTANVPRGTSESK